MNKQTQFLFFTGAVGYHNFDEQETSTFTINGVSIFSNVNLSTSDVDESSEFVAVRFEATFEGAGLNELFENLTLLEPFSDAYRNVIATSAGKLNALPLVSCSLELKPRSARS